MKRGKSKNKGVIIGVVVAVIAIVALILIFTNPDSSTDNLNNSGIEGTLGSSLEGDTSNQNEDEGDSGTPAGSVCGNDDCEEGEAFEICPEDCPRIDAECGNGICEGGESYTISCPADCTYQDRVGTQNNDGACEPGEDIEREPGDCTDIRPNCGNDVCNEWESRDTCYADCKGDSSGSGDECNSNSDCGYKEVCRSGTCTRVDCTNDAHCSSGKECESNRCVSCGSGPYGSYC